MKNRILFAIFLLLTHLGVWGQIGGDYDPTNPSDPGTPIQKYTLTLNATPSGGGSFNTTSTKVAVGENYNLRAWPNSDYNFVAWVCNGDTISKLASYNYVMPAHNVDITGVFVYNPKSPSDPDEQPLKYQLSLTASPMNSGSFNFSNERLAAGSVNSLYAYTNTDYVFKQWMMGDSVLSTSRSLEFVMPAHNVQIVGLFEYNPTSPENPNKNYWNKETGEVIVDDFTPNDLYSAISNAIGSSSNSDVNMIIVAGKLGDYDFGIADNFSNCSLLDLSRTTGVTEIPSYAFDYTNLESVYLPATVEKIGYRAFADCPQLLSLTVYAMTPPALDSYVFDGVQEGLVVYVPAAAIPQYQEAEGWKDFTLLPIQEDIRNLTVNLPAGINVAAYAQMWLELTNTKNGQRIHYVMTDKTAYTFMNIIRNTSWNVTLCNQSGDVFGRIDNVEVKDEDITVTFASLTQPKSVNLSVKTPDGQDVTQQTQITWTDADGKYLSQGNSLTGLPVGYQTKYKVSLSEQLAMLYNIPAEADYTLTATDNNPVCQLTAIGQVKVSGKVIDKKTNQPISGAVISASQTFGGKYSKTFSCKTDNKGEYSIDLYKVPSSIAISASDYVSQTLVCDSVVDASSTLAMQEVALKEIAGAVISLNLTYTPCTEDGETVETQNWFSDYNNVGYTLYNKTNSRAISQFNVQYPQIVLLEEVADGDELLITATSKTGAFMPVQENIVITDQAAEATIGILELGKINASFNKNINSSVKGILYDGNGKLVKSYDYAQASLSISNLTDGSYTLISMGDSKLFSCIYDLVQFSQAGLAEGTDYVKNTVTVQSGRVSKISIEEIPTFNESKLYYTGDNTSFTVNKSSVVAGNYLTLSGRIDFKPAYMSAVSNIQMVVDLPENSSFVENSVMVGNSTGSYTLNGNRLTIPIARLNDRIRFCVIPTLGGEYSPSAFAQFDINGETITQPIGSANYTAKDLSIVVPSTVAKTTVPVSGTAIGKCDIEIYDNDMLVGQTTSLANGTWATSIELKEPYNLSTHNIYAKVTTKQGLGLLSETHSCTYDMNAIQVMKVTMYHYNPEMNKTYESVFDFQNPKASPTQWTVYYPNKKFTYTIEFTNNSPEKVSDVILYVHTADGQIVPLHPKYDENRDLWVADIDMGSSPGGYYPVNCSVDFDFSSDIEADRNQLDSTVESINDGRDKIRSVKSDVAEIEDEISTSIALQEENAIKIQALLNQLKSQSGNTNNTDIYKELYILLGWQFDESNISVDHTVDTSQEFIDSLMSGVESSLAESPVDFDNLESEFNKTLTESDELIAVIDEQAAIDDKSLDNFDDRQFVIQTAMGDYDYSEVTADQIDRSAWDEEHIIKINLTDGSQLLVYNSDDIIIVDEAKNKAWKLLKKEPQILSPKRISGDEIIQNLHEAFNTLNSAKTLIMNMIGDWKEAINKEIAQLEANQALVESKWMDELAESAATQRKIEKLERQLQEMGKQVKNGTSANYMGEAVDFNNKIEQLKAKRAELLRKAELHNKSISRYKNQIGKLKSKILVKVAILGEIMDYWNIVTGITKLIDIIQYGIRDWNTWQSMINYILPCEADYNNALKIKKDAEAYKNKWCRGYVGAGSLSIASTSLSGYCAFNKAAKFVMKTVGALVADFINNTATQIYNETKDNSRRTLKEIKLRRSKLKCKPNCGDTGMPPCPGDGDGNSGSGDGNSGSGSGNSGSGNGYGSGGSHTSGSPNDNVQIDPSGFVYEAVAANRLEGVTSTIFYKEEVEDMYGDIHENIVKWDAAEYAQENPLFTDENGMYRWDVPQGLWQVKFEKDGYETTYSEWLPVPPPQLDVNIAMKQNVQPLVKNARAFEDAVEVEFDKYMMPELLNTDNILVMADGKALEGKVELMDEEVSYEGNTDTYASKIRFNAVDPFPTKDVTLLVKNQVKSYAGIRMQDDYQQVFAVEQEVRKIACDSLTTIIYGEATEVTVSVLPAAVSAGKTINVKALSDIIISVEEQQLTLDEEGKASFLVKGELPGTSALTFSMDGYDISATTIVNVETESSIVTATPNASIASGSEVNKGTEVYLTCATDDATIYYTLDGSCPCDETGSRKVYDGTPIIINNSVTLKAMAVAKGKTESDVAEFVYTITVNDGIDDVTLNTMIDIFPLPVREKLNVTAGGKVIKKVIISSLRGNIVASSSKAATKVTLDVGRIPAGIYIITVTTEDGIHHRKIQKTR